MKKYKITYQSGQNIMVKEVKAENKEQALYLFYMSTACHDVLKTEEVQDEAESQ